MLKMLEIIHMINLLNCEATIKNQIVSRELGGYTYDLITFMSKKCSIIKGQPVKYVAILVIHNN